MVAFAFRLTGGGHEGVPQADPHSGRPEVCLQPPRGSRSVGWPVSTRCPPTDGFPGQPRPRLTYAATPVTARDDGWLCSRDMTHLTAMTAAHVTDRLADWQTALRAENKAPGTVAIYADGATRYLRWCAEGDHLPMSRAALNSWIAGLLDAGAAPGTARIRQLACAVSRPG